MLFKGLVVQKDTQTLRWLRPWYTAIEASKITKLFLFVCCADQVKQELREQKEVSHQEKTKLEGELADAKRQIEEMQKQIEYHKSLSDINQQTIKVQYMGYF